MTHSRSYQSWILWLAGSVAITSTLTSAKDVALAQQIKPDNTLGAESSVITPEVNIKGILSNLIEGGAVRGVNLFHSFEEFNVGDGQSVYFNNPAGIEHILSRVTGNSRSEILGTLGVFGGNADLFLINPNGIIFGSNAVLDLNGSFLATTASSITFADGSQFSATNPSAQPLLTVSVPIGLQFGKTLESIANQSQVGLQVQPGKTLAFVGGNITMQGGNLQALEGRIELGSVGSDAKVSLKPIEKGWELGYEGIENFMDIRLLQGSTIEADTQEEGQGGGDIQLQGRRVTIADGSGIFATVLEGSQPGGTLKITASDSVDLKSSILATATVSTGDAGNIIIDTGRLTLQDKTTISTESTTIRFPDGEVQQANGKAGDLIVNTEQLIISGGSQIIASTRAQGKGGDILINAVDTVNISGVSPDNGRLSGLFTTTEAGAGRQGGEITVNTGDLRISDGAVLSASTGSDFRGGNIEVNVNTLELTGGGEILTTASSNGNAGNISVNAIKSVTVTGNDPTFASRLSKFGAVDNNSSASGLFANAASGSTGVGGNIFLDANKVTIQNGAGIFVNSLGTGNAGNIELQVNSLTLDNEAFLSAGTSTGEGGNLALQVQDLLLLRRNSQISTTAGNAGNGGDIKIDVPFIVAVPKENSDISANAVRGNGGSVKITTEGIFGIGFQKNQNSISGITASSEFGLNGVVKISSPNVNPNQGLVKLPDEPVDLARLIDQNLCSAAKESEFIVTGRGGLAKSPNEPLTPNAGWEDWRLGESSEPGEEVSQSISGPRIVSAPRQETNERPKAQILEFQGWALNGRGNVVLTAQANTVTPQGVWLPAPACQQSKL